MDMYLHVVDRREDGIVVRGAKLHNTMAPYADELIVIPTRALNKDEKDYAVAFAIPADTDGVYLIARDAFSVKREPGMEAPYNDFGDIESFTVFDNVFIPTTILKVIGTTYNSIKSLIKPQYIVCILVTFVVGLFPMIEFS